MTRFLITTMAAVGAVSLALCGCNAGRAKGTVPVYDYHGAMAHQSIYAGEPGKTNQEAEAMANLEPAAGSTAQGTIVFTQTGSGVRAEGSITGLTAGPHDIYVSDKTDCASTAGSKEPPSGNPGATSFDMGNIIANPSGVAVISRVFYNMTLTGSDSIMGRAVVVRSGQEDTHSNLPGDAGGRVACGVIQQSH